MNNMKIEQNLFTEEELKILNLSEQELNDILDADALAKTAAMLPEEPDAILKKIDKQFPDDAAGILEKYAELAKKDPKFIMQLIAMNEIFGEVKPEEPPKVEKVSLTDVNNEIVKEGLDKINEILKRK